MALLGAGLAILSKASTVMLPVVLGLCWWWTDGQWRWRNVLRLAPFVLISAAASGWTIWEQQVHFGAVGPEWAQTWPQRVVIAGKVVWFYLGRLMWPHPLIFVYPRWEIDASQPAAYLPALAVAVCLFGLGLARRRLGPLFLAFAYFCVSLFPVLGFFKVYFFRYSFVADHFQYLASIGPLALAAAGISALFGSLEERRSSWEAALCGAVLSALCVLTWRQSRTYESDETLWRATVEGNPGSWMAHNSLGVELERAGKRAEALPEYTEAQRLGPSHAEPYNNLGNALVRSGKADGAVESFTRALRLKRNDPGLHNNLAVALSMNGRWDDAIREYTEAIRLDPNRPETHFSLARALAQVGRRQQAAMHLKQALRLKPDYKQANELLEGLATAAK